MGEKISSWVMENRNEVIVKEAVDAFLDENRSACSCERCRLDLVALVLNSLKPKYVVTELGRILTNLNLAGNQSKADILGAIISANEIVKKKPRH
ncbi:late competence development ComFB family protein [bacterium]|nr:late competence development ComFB family protein [bacterium]